MPGGRDPLEDLLREPTILRSIRRQTDRHRMAHGPDCDAFPSAPWVVRLLGTLAGTARGGRILEVGCGLGLTAVALARGMRTGRVDTVERRHDHAELTRRNVARARLGRRVHILEGDAERVLRTLKDPYDLVLEDASYATTPSYYDDLVRLTRPGGLLIWENWFPLGPDHPYVTAAEKAATTRWARRAIRDRRLTTSIVRGLGISVRK